MFLLGFIPNTHTEIKAQSYRTQSKSCGSCGREVSIHSKTGDYCPHCGVYWGYENETRTSSYSESYERNYSENNNREGEKKYYLADNLTGGVRDLSKEKDGDRQRLIKLYHNPKLRRDYFKQQQQEFLKRGDRKSAKELEIAVRKLDKQIYEEEQAELQRDLTDKLEQLSKGYKYNPEDKILSQRAQQIVKRGTKSGKSLKEINKELDKVIEVQEKLDSYTDYVKKNTWIKGGHTLGFYEDAGVDTSKDNMFIGFLKVVGVFIYDTAKGIGRSILGGINNIMEMAGKDSMQRDIRNIIREGIGEA